MLNTGQKVSYVYSQRVWSLTLPHQTVRTAVGLSATASLTTCSVLCTEGNTKRHITFVHIPSASQRMARKPWSLCGRIYLKIIHPLVLDCKTKSKQMTIEHNFTKCSYSYMFRRLNLCVIANKFSDIIKSVVREGHIEFYRDF